MSRRAMFVVQVILNATFYLIAGYLTYRFAGWSASESGIMVITGIFSNASGYLAGLTAKP